MFAVETARVNVPDRALRAYQVLRYHREEATTESAQQ